MVAEQLTIPPKPMEEFVPSVLVKGRSGEELPVPVDADANRAESKVIGMELREFLRDQLEKIKKRARALKPEDIKNLVIAAAKVEEMNRFAHAPGMEEFEGKKSDVRAVADAVRAVANASQAATEAKTKGTSRMEKILQLGRGRQEKVVEAVVEDMS